MKLIQIIFLITNILLISNCTHNLQAKATAARLNVPVVVGPVKKINDKPDSPTGKEVKKFKAFVESYVTTTSSGTGSSRVSTTTIYVGNPDDINLQLKRFQFNDNLKFLVNSILVTASGYDDSQAVIIKGAVHDIK